MEWGHVFPMAADTIKTGWLQILFGGMLLLWVGMFFFLTRMIHSAAQAEIALRDGALVVRASFYGRTIPLAEVDVAGATRLDLGQKGPKSLRRRTNGIGMPGLAAGWYRLADGEKALVFVTDKHKAVYVPTRRGFAVVISPADPDGFLHALRHAPGRDGEDASGGRGA